jgi:DNA ligase (NAD+)
MKLDDTGRQQALGVTAGRPKGQVAWKFDSAGAQTVLEDVVVSGGHTGALVPVGKLRPVDIGGTTVSSVSLANYDEIARLDVAVGDSVWLIKANDIIPKIVRVTDRPSGRRPIAIPTACPFCGGAVARRLNTSGESGVVLECRNAACPKKSSGKISRWISGLDIQGIGDSVLEAMLDRFGIEDAADLYRLSDRAAELGELIINREKDIRLGDKRAQAILSAIDATRVLSLPQFLGSLGIACARPNLLSVLAPPIWAALFRTVLMRWPRSLTSCWPMASPLRRYCVTRRAGRFRLRYGPRCVLAASCPADSRNQTTNSLLLQQALNWSMRSVHSYVIWSWQRLIPPAARHRRRAS